MSTVRSTTGTAPLKVTPGPKPGEIYVELDDGSEQVYDAADLVDACIVEVARNEAHAS